MDRRRLYQRTLTFGPEDCCHAKWRSEPIPPVINPCCNYDPKKMLFVDRHLARGWTMGDRVLDNFCSPSDPSCMFIACRDEGVEGRREKETEASDSQHSKEHSRAQRLPHLGSSSCRYHQRSNAENERE